MALDENATPFEPQGVGGPDSSAAQWLAGRWPMKRFPVLTDGERTALEARCIVAHLDLWHPGPARPIATEGAHVRPPARDRPAPVGRVR